MAEEEFEIDIYGDAGGDQSAAQAVEDSHAYEGDEGAGHDANGDGHDDYNEGHHDDMDTGDHGQETDPVVKSETPQPAQQGIKRKETSDERPVDPGATTALMISELAWWDTDDVVRGWANQAKCEDELKGITFSEHKVNGKSKG